MYIYIYIYVYMYICLCIISYLSICLPVSTYLYLPIIYVFVSLVCIYLSISLSLYLYVPIYLSIYPSIHLSLCRSIYLAFYLIHSLSWPAHSLTIRTPPTSYHSLSLAVICIKRSSLTSVLCASAGTRLATHWGRAWRVHFFVPFCFFLLRSVYSFFFN